MGKLKTLRAFRFISFSTLFFLMSSCSSLAPQASTALDTTINTDAPLHIYLVRHAEKTLQEKDPALTPEGQTRALELNNVLADVPLKSIYSSNYRRTLETAAPTEAFFELKAKLYNPRELVTFADELRTLQGVHLVVGHSNTTPQLVDLLGGDSISEINEASEYDRLYLVMISNDGKVTSQLMRYGKPYQTE